MNIHTLISAFEIEEILTLGSKSVQFIIMKKKPVSERVIVADQESKKWILNSAIPLNSTVFARRNVYPIGPYAEILGVNNNNYSGFDHFPYLSSCSIISPFRNKNEFEDIQKLIESLKLKEDDQVKAYLLNNFVASAINQKIIDAIISNSISSRKPNEEEIRETYSQFILDLLKLS